MSSLANDELVAIRDSTRIAVRVSRVVVAAPGPRISSMPGRMTPARPVEVLTRLANPIGTVVREVLVRSPEGMVR